jgi:hypothetical protein
MEIGPHEPLRGRGKVVQPRENQVPCGNDEPRIWRLTSIGASRFTWRDMVFEPGFLVVRGIHTVGSLVNAASPVRQTTACGISELRLARAKVPYTSTCRIRICTSSAKNRKFLQLTHPQPMPVTGDLLGHKAAPHSGVPCRICISRALVVGPSAEPEPRGPQSSQAS